MNTKGCGTKYIAFQMFGVIVAGTVAVRWVVNCINSIKTLRIIYGVMGIVVIIGAAVSIGYSDYVSQDKDGVYCDEFYCHKQVYIPEYLEMVKSKNGESYLDTTCNEMKRKYGSRYHEKIRESLLQGLFIYQYNRQKDEDFQWSLELPDYEIVQILIILISALELVYAILLFYHSWRIKTFKIHKLEKHRKKSNQNTPKNHHKVDKEDEEELELDNLLRKKRNKPLVIKNVDPYPEDMLATSQKQNDDLSFRGNETDMPLNNDRNPHDFSYYGDDQNKPMGINELPGTTNLPNQEDLQQQRYGLNSRQNGTQDRLNMSDDISQRIDTNENEISFGEQNQVNQQHEDEEDDGEFLP